MCISRIYYFTNLRMNVRKTSEVVTYSWNMYSNERDCDDDKDQIEVVTVNNGGHDAPQHARKRISQY